LQGDINFNSIGIKLYNNSGIFFDGTLKAVSGFSGDMVSFASLVTLTQSCGVFGVGNKAVIDGNNIATDGVSIVNHVANHSLATFPTYTISSFEVKNCLDDGVYVDFQGYPGTTIWQNDVSVLDCGGYFVQWEYVPDSRLIGGLISGQNTNYAILLHQCSDCEIHPSYLIGHSQIWSCNMIDFSCQFLDNGGNYPTLDLWGVSYSNIHDSNFRRIDGTNNTYAGVSMNNTWGATSTYNNFHGLFFGRVLGVGAYQFSYGVEETDNTQNYNNMYGITAQDCVAVRRLGASSIANSATIIGTVATS
jgi:hypothetical protein